MSETGKHRYPGPGVHGSVWCKYFGTFVYCSKPRCDACIFKTKRAKDAAPLPLDLDDVDSDELSEAMRNV